LEAKGIDTEKFRKSENQNVGLWIQEFRDCGIEGFKGCEL
jgi:hypothetical protein